MLKEAERKSTISIRQFFVRRSLRIIPPLIISLILIYFVAFMHGYRLETLSGISSQLFFYYNYFKIYSVTNSVFDGTGVIWSLAVEEHYYLVFPFIFFAFQKYLGLSSRNIFAMLLLAVCGFVMAWRIALFDGTALSVEHIYLATDTRIDSILFGAIFALFFYSKEIDPFNTHLTPKDYAILVASLIVISLTFLVRDEYFRWTFRFTVQGMALWVFFYYAIFRSNAWLFRILNFRYIQTIGIYSYTIYLAHAALSNILTQYYGFSEGAKLGCTVFLLSVLAGFLMNKWVEKPLAKMRSKYN